MIAKIEGTGIKEASEESKKVAQVYYGGPEAENKRRVKSFLKEFQEKSPLSGGSGGTIKIPDMVPITKASADGDETFERRDFFSMKTDPRNEVKVATAGDFSGTFNESDYKSYINTLGIKNYRGLPPTMQRMLKENYIDDVKGGRFKEGQLINQAPKQEKPSFIDQTKKFAGSIFDAVTGTQPAAASQIPGGMPSGTQLSPSEDTSFASYRMGGGEQQQQSETVVTPKVKPQYQINREQNRPSVGGGGEGQQKGIVSPTSTVTPRQTVASLPSNYKQTEAEAFRKTAAFKEAQGIAKRNPNVKVGVDSKGQPEATAANNSGVAKAQAAAVNRKISGKSISQTKAANKASMRKAAAKRNASFQARKKAGKLSSSERTAKGQRAAKKAAARKRAQAAAKKRKAKKKSKSK